MRYWVYQDSRILGPFGKDDLSSVHGLSQDSLVCKSDASGVRDNDWQALGSIPELLGAPRAAAPFSPAFSEGASEFDAFRGTAHAAIDMIGSSEFGTGIFDSPSLFDSWGGAPGEYGSDAVSRAARMRAEDLEQTLAEMRSRLADYEARQDDILGRLSLKDEELKRKDKELEALRDRYASDLAAAAAPPPMPISPIEDFEIPEEKPAPQAPPPPPVFEPEAPAPKPKRSLKNPAGLPEPPAAPSAPAPAAAPDPALTQALEEKEKILEHQKKALAALREKLAALESKGPAAAAPIAAGPAPAAPAPDPIVADEPPPMPEIEVAPLKAVAADPAFEAPSTLSLSPTAGLPPTEMFTPPAPEDEAQAPEFEIPQLPDAEAPPAIDLPELSAAPQLEPEITLRPEDGPELQPVPGFEAPGSGGPEEELRPPQTQAPGFGELPPSAWEGPSEHGGPATEPAVIDMSPTTKPKTMLLGAAMAGPTPVPGTGPVNLSTPVPGHTPTPMPIPLGQTAPQLTPMPGQGETPMPMMGQPDIPQTVLQGMGVGGQTTPIPGAPPAETGSFDELLGRPSTVPPSFGGRPTTGVIAGLPGAAESAPAPSKLKRLQSKGFLIGLGAAGLGLVLIMLYFLKDPKKVKQMVEMSPESQAPQGSLEDPTPVVGAPEQPVNIDPLAPQPGAFPQAEPEPAPQPEPAAAGRDFIEDKQVEAMDRVKGHVLDEERGTISAEFDFRYPPPYMPEWSAGAVEKDVWLVEYRIFDNMRAKKPRITYSFEVDLAGGGLIGRNDSAKSLLGGKPAEPVKAAKPRARPKAKARPKRRPPRKTAARDSGQLPLPEEEDLDGFGAQSPGGFNNPGGGE